MGIKYIPENEFVYVMLKGEVDDFGIRASSSDKTKLGCLIRSAEDSTPIESTGGKQVIPTYTISFNGKVAVGVGDFIEVEGQKKQVLTKKEVKDLSRVVIITKVTV